MAAKINGPYGKAGNTQETIMRLLKKDDKIIQILSVRQIIQKTSVIFIFR